MTTAMTRHVHTRWKKNVFCFYHTLRIPDPRIPKSQNPQNPTSSGHHGSPGHTFAELAAWSHRAVCHPAPPCINDKSCSECHNACASTSLQFSVANLDKGHAMCSLNIQLSTMSDSQKVWLRESSILLLKVSLGEYQLPARGPRSLETFQSHVCL